MSTKTPEFKLVKVTQPLWLGNIGPKIEEFRKETNIPGMAYESLFTYLTNSIQFGKQLSEFWVVFDGDKVVAFAHWLVRGLPYVGTVLLDVLKSWSKSSEPVNLLMAEYGRFSKRSRAVVSSAVAIDEKRYRRFKIGANKQGWEAIKTGEVNFTMQEKAEVKE